MNWWNESYIDKKLWILDQYETLNIQSDEAIVLLMIDFFEKQNKEVSLDLLNKKTKLEKKEIDHILSSLMSKGYLTIKAEEGKIRYSIDGLFLQERKQVNLTNIFELFEDEFQRILSQNELRIINEWLMDYSEDEIVDALRQASIYNKKNFNYIRTILSNQKGKK